MILNIIIFIIAGIICLYFLIYWGAFFFSVGQMNGWTKAIDNFLSNKLKTIKNEQKQKE